MQKTQDFNMCQRTNHVEIVCLLSKLHAEQHIKIDINMDELDLTAAESKATYEKIKAYNSFVFREVPQVNPTITQ